MPSIRRTIFVLLALAPAAARAAVVTRGGAAASIAEVFAAPEMAWGPALSLASPAALRTAAPLVHSLSHNLSLTPAALVALPAPDREAAVEVAVENAREEVRTKAYALSAEARVLSRKDGRMDAARRAALYASVSRLKEMREHYAAWLDADGKAAVDDGYRSAAERAWEVRSELLAPSVSAPTPTRFELKPTTNAVKLRERLRNSQAGWGQDDFDALLKGYGFARREGGNHRVYTHPVFPEVHQTIPRSNELPPAQGKGALKALERLEELSAARFGGDQARSGPPEPLQMAELSVLLSPR